MMMITFGDMMRDYEYSWSCGVPRVTYYVFWKGGGCFAIYPHLSIMEIMTLTDDFRIRKC